MGIDAALSRSPRAVRRVLAALVLCALTLLGFSLPGSLREPKSAIEREGSPWTLYTAVGPGEAPAKIRDGELPWWSHPELEVAPLRPLASGLHWVNQRLEGGQRGLQALAFSCWLALLLCFGLFVRSLLGPTRAWLATSMLACSPSAWAALDSGDPLVPMLPLTLATLALWLHARDIRRARSKPNPWTFVVCTAALGAGEHAVPLAALALALEMTRESTSAKRHALALLPWALPLLGRWAWSGLGGYGYHEAASFPDPWGAPVRTLRTLQGSVPAIFAQGFWGLPIIQFRSNLAGWAVAALVAVVVLRNGRARTTDGCLLAGAVGALFAGATPFQTQYVLLAELGGALWLAEVLPGGLCKRGGPLPERALRVGLAGGLLLSHLLVAPYLATDGAMLGGRAIESRERALAKLRVPRQARHVFVVNAIDLLGVGSAQHFAGRTELHWHVLSPATGPHTLRRLDARTLELETSTAGIFSNPATADFSASGPRRFERGRFIPTKVFGVHLDEVHFDGPKRMRFVFPKPLESPAYFFVRATGDGGFRELPLPPVGSRQVLPAANVDEDEDEDGESP